MRALPRQSDVWPKRPYPAPQTPPTLCFTDHRCLYSLRATAAFLRFHHRLFRRTPTRIVRIRAVTRASGISMRCGRVSAADFAASVDAATTVRTARGGAVGKRVETALAFYGIQLCEPTYLLCRRFYHTTRSTTDTHLA
eukprot:IDg4957t1